MLFPVRQHRGAICSGPAGPARHPGTRFKLGTALRQGMLSVVWAADDPISVLEAYNALRVEVDFVIDGETGFYAIEVKNAKRIDASDLTALKHFAEDYPQAKRYLLYRGDDRLKRDGILCLPAEQFLAELKPNHFPASERAATEASH